MQIRDNSKWWSHILTAKGRASRTEYNILMLICLLPLIIVTAMQFYGMVNITKWQYSLHFLFGYVIVVMYLMICAAIRRNHDLGREGLSRNFMSDLDFVFKKGDIGPNRFGSDPTMNYHYQLEESGNE